MIHSMGGGVIRNYDNLIYCKVQLDGEENAVRWYISPYVSISVGDRVLVPCGISSTSGTVLRIENVTAQTAPTPVKRTQEILSIII